MIQYGTWENKREEPKQFYIEPVTTSAGKKKCTGKWYGWDNYKVYGGRRDAGSWVDERRVYLCGQTDGSNAFI